MAKLLGGQGKVYAFEPWPENYACLSSNLRHNDGLNESVVALHKAVGATDGTVYLTGGSSDGHHHLQQGSELADVEGTIVSLDCFIKSGNPCPALMKIDVEGMEANVIEGAKEILRQSKPILILEHHKRQDELKDVLKQFAYQLEPLGVRHLYAH
jgi:FkbM family methyltransferase